MTGGFPVSPTPFQSSWPGDGHAVAASAGSNIEVSRVEGPDSLPWGRRKRFARNDEVYLTGSAEVVSDEVWIPPADVPSNCRR